MHVAAALAVRINWGSTGAMTFADPPSFADRPQFGRRSAPGEPKRRTEIGWQPPSGMVGLSFANFFLGIITLGIYHFWGRTEVRKRIWSAIRIEGEPLSYTGTGWEMFVGFLIVFFVVLVPALLTPLAMTFAFGTTGAVAAQGFIFLLFIYLYGVAVYRALRYRLSRTRWRGIRGSLAGSANSYGLTSLWTSLLIPLTLGWIYPWRATRLQRLLVEDMRFGDRPFTFTENPGPLYGRFIVLWLGGLVAGALYIGGIVLITAKFMVKAGPKTPPHLTPEGTALIFALVFVCYIIFLLASSWYRAGQFNHFAASTSFEGVPMHGAMTGLGLLGLTLTNFLLVIVSLGILQPIAQARSARYFLKSLSFNGPVSFDAIAQAWGGDTGRGEGLAQAFDFDAF